MAEPTLDDVIHLSMLLWATHTCDGVEYRKAREAFIAAYVQMNGVEPKNDPNWKKRGGIWYDPEIDG